MASEKRERKQYLVTVHYRDKRPAEKWVEEAFDEKHAARRAKDTAIDPVVIEVRPIWRGHAGPVSHTWGSFR